MSYHIFLSFNNNAEGFEIPVLPETIEIQHKGNNKSNEVLTLGEITQQRLPKGFTLKIKSEFPSSWYPAITSDVLYNPSYYIKTIENWFLKLRPIRLVITGGTVELNSPVSIESFDYDEEGGDVGTWHYELSLKEYKFYGAEKIYIDSQQNNANEEQIEATVIKKRENTREVPQTYVVKEGDTLSKISRQLYGNDDGYWNLKRLNGLTDEMLNNGLRVRKGTKGVLNGT